ncbi:MAG: biopolymer transporter ExbD [Gammaproteobacteria bacterium]|nr:MAG: biopolymer transporter ExbD [Gammaproteobacteria bacterium]
MIRKKAKVQDAEIDMTPMLDVVFIMLIFFIVTTSFVKESGVNVNKPYAPTAIKKKNASIFIAIKEDGTIWVSKKEVEVKNLRSLIEDIKLENPEGQVVIQADQRAKSGVLLKTFDAIKAAGVKDVSVAARVKL